MSERRRARTWPWIVVPLLLPALWTVCAYLALRGEAAPSFTYGM